MIPKLKEAKGWLSHVDDYLYRTQDEYHRPHYAAIEKLKFALDNIIEHLETTEK